LGYIKVAYKEILRYLDCYSVLPKGWNEFVEKQEKNHNLIIKSSKNKCYCTNCNHNFISTKKVNEEVKCPNCHNKYLIKRSNLRYHEFKDYLSILDNVNDTFVIRYFELKTIIDAEHEHNSSVVEFAREIPTNDYYREVFINDRVSKCQCHIYIHHSNNNYFDAKRWREYTRNYSLIDYSIVFPNNIKQLLKNTEYKYSCIWDIAKHSTYIDLLELIKNKNALPKVELLSKMKLYNLALRANEFYNKGSFQEIFGVSKDFYPFMKRNNITYRQLKILRLLKEKDINKIRYLEKFTSYGESTDDLEEISKYISLNRFIKYSKMHHKNIKTYLYKDYLRFAKILGLDLKNNRYAFPKNLKEEHDKLEAQYEIQSKILIQKAIIKRGKELLANKYQNNKFIILPARTLKEMQDESKQQNNCVRTYAEKYAEGTCDIYFMRDIKKPKKSLVTVEVKNNRVVQSRIKNNYDPNEKQIQFLQKWEQNVLKGAA
jgi:DNA-directed RNA polymerase subunit RPC12/RpoP